MNKITKQKIFLQGYLNKQAADRKPIIPITKPLRPITRPVLPVKPNPQSPQSLQNPKVQANIIAGKVLTPEFRNRIAGYEGTRYTPYKDTTGHSTIGIGANLETLTQQEAMKAGINTPVKKIRKLTPQQVKSLYNLQLTDKTRHLFLNRPELTPTKLPIQQLLSGMNYQLGYTGLSKFKDTLRAAAKNDVSGVIEGVRNSVMYRQAPNKYKQELSILQKAFPVRPLPFKTIRPLKPVR